MALAVSTAYTGRRIAKLLIAVAVEHMVNSGSPHCHLLVTRDDALRTPHLHKLYRSMGFKGGESDTLKQNLSVPFFSICEGNDRGSGHFTLHPIPDDYSRTGLLAPARAGAALWDPPELEEAARIASAAATKRTRQREREYAQRDDAKPNSETTSTDADDTWSKKIANVETGIFKTDIHTHEEEKVEEEDS